MEIVEAERTYGYQLDTNGNEVRNLIASSGDTKKQVTVEEFRDFLNELIEAGYGTYSLEADTQDGALYSVRKEVIISRVSKDITIF